MAVQQQVKLEGQDHADSRVESYCTISLLFDHCITFRRTVLILSIDCSNSKHSLPRQYGCDCGCPNIPPNPCHRQSRLYARHEGVLDHLSHCIGICAEVPAGIPVGAILQLCSFRHRNLHQHTHQEEAPCCVEEEGRRAIFKHVQFRPLMCVTALR